MRFLPLLFFCCTLGASQVRRRQMPTIVIDWVDTRVKQPNLGDWVMTTDGKRLTIFVHKNKRTAELIRKSTHWTIVQLVLHQKE